MAASPAPAARRRSSSSSRKGRRHRVEIALAEHFPDPAGREAADELTAAGLPGVSAVRVVRTWFLGGPMSKADARRAAREVLADPVQDRFTVDEQLELDGERGEPVWITVMRKPGVTNPEAESARLALGSLGLPIEEVQSARSYAVWIDGAEADNVLHAARRALGNDVIEDVTAGRVSSYAFPRPAPARVRRRIVRIRRLEAEALEALSQDMGLSLSVTEMEAIRGHYRELGREPTDVELETLAQTWSEHCKHKTLAGAIHMRDDHGERHYDNLLKETVFHATEALARPWCWSVFEDNAGVIDFDGEHGVCMKVETHNHPSAIEPYGGAGTGIGGVIRDILGTGLGARPVANTDVFCFGDPGLDPDEVPRGAMHPLRLLKGVVAGVRDYGNRMGIPTVNGAIVFDPRYVGNPVVYAGCVGLLPKKDVKKAARPGDLIVAFGGRTGRDGIHGATFSSVELHSESESVSSGAVQIGDPITEKKVLDVLLQGRRKGYFTAVTDCGAGGFSSAVGEMGEQVGAEVDLSAAPLKYPGLEPFEIWISEAQERMVAAVPPKRWPAFEKLCQSEDVEAVVLGTFTGDGRLRVRHRKTVVADLDMAFLHDGLPRVVRKAVYDPPRRKEPRIQPRREYGRDLLGLLRMPQIGSKEWVIRQYDHEVQAGAAVRPLVGPHQGPGDAAVLAPKLGSRRGIVLSGGINPAYGDLDPYEMARLAVDEALRNAVAVGADPKRIALLDNFTWGNCQRPETLGTIVRAAEGCRDAALMFKTPFISGKDSLNNEFRTEDGELIVVPPTLLISAIGVITDVRKTCTMDLKKPGSAIYVVGDTHDECGGSHWYRMKGRLGANVPHVDDGAPATLGAIAHLIRSGWVRAAHDPSEGGLAVALAEMAFASPYGIAADLTGVPGTTRAADRILFSETPTRLVLEVAPETRARLERYLDQRDVPYGRIGTVTDEPWLVVQGRDPLGRSRRRVDLIRLETAKLRTAWRRALPLATGHPRTRRRSDSR